MMAFGTYLSRWFETWLVRRGALPAIAPDGSAKFLATSLFERSGRSFLHVGCGSSRKPYVAPGFLVEEWNEIRLDIDPRVAPDIVASMLDMPQVPTESVDAVYSSHNLEHLYPHEVPVALAEFFRVLKPAGVLVLTCPDLQSICRLVVADKLDEPAYFSPVGAVAPLDVLYGLRSSIAAGNLHMAHRTGFTLKTLTAAVGAAGFPAITGKRREAVFDLWLVASKSPLSVAAVFSLASVHLPP
jgi:SAM-dependent methyltransferase